MVILLTDGRESAPTTRLIDPLTALEIAKEQHVKVYTIGVSAAPSTVVESTDAPNRNRNPAADQLDEDLLRKIANETGGRYFRALDHEGLKNIYQQIDTMEKSKVEITTFKKYEDLFPLLILVASGLLFLEMILRFTILKRFP